MSSSSIVLEPSPEARLAAPLSRLRLRSPFVVAATAFLVALVALLIAHRPAHLAVPKPVAIRHAQSDHSMAQILSGLNADRTDVAPLDARSEVVEFYRGSRLVASAVVQRKRGVVVSETTDWVRRSSAYGSNIANDVRVLGALSAVFLLMTAVWPLRRVRNLDALVTVSLTLSVVLFNRGQLVEMVLVTYPALAYLALRCAWWALSVGSAHARPSTPLYDVITRRLTSRQRRRILRLGVFAAGLVTVMVGLSSMRVLDVGYAVMEGATAIVHGLLPYGHVPDVWHGDTYPLASYLVYVPFAWSSPVTSMWDSADATLDVAVVGALLLSGSVWWLLRRLARAAAETEAPSTAGLRAALALLTFPPLLVTVSTGSTDVVLALMLLTALILWHRPVWAAVMLNAAAWFKLAPVALLPVLVGRLPRSAALSAWAALVGTSAAMLGLLIALGGVDGPARMVQAITFQFTRSSPHTLWTVVGSVPLQQLAQAAAVAWIAGSVLWLRRNRSLAEDRLRVAAVLAATLLGLELGANYWNYMYLTWVAPFLVISLFAGGATNRRLPPRAATDAAGR